MGKPLDILVACERSGIVRDAFIAAGHNAVSCDLHPSATPGTHYQGDVRDVLNDGWDMMIAHPVCTYLCNSGARWLYEEKGRWEKMEEAAAFFKLLLNYKKIKMRALENPIMHGHARRLIGGATPSQIIHPWQHGHPESKATGLYLRNLRLIKPTNIVRRQMMLLPDKEKYRMHWGCGATGEERSRLRSETFPGIANAFAAQWGIAQKGRFFLA